MTPLTEETARELIEVIRELSFVVKGLTGVLIDDQGEPDEADPAAQAPAAAPIRYMDAVEIEG